MAKKNKKVACYLRLSRDEVGKSESSSISEQKKILSKYCIDNNIFNYTFFIDDGVSGVTFDRPAFNELKEKIEAKEISCVITKDLSRLGRDYISVGYYTEIYFPNNQVRYIAIHDGLDSENNVGMGEELSPFINFFNEQYVKDTSIKIRSVMEAKARQGEYLTGLAPYGYKKSEENNKKLVVDIEVSEVIMFIFKQSSEGKGAGAIRKILTEQQVLTPSAYKNLKYGMRFSHLEKDELAKYRWTNKMVLDILKNKLFIGTKVYYKDRKATHKSRRLVQSEDKRLVVEGACEPIVDEELFYLVQEQLSEKSNVNYKREKPIENIFKGKVKCGCCGWNMNVTEVKIKTTDGSIVGSKRYLVCGRKERYGEEVCRGNNIGYDELVEVLLQEFKSLNK